MVEYCDMYSSLSIYYTELRPCEAKVIPHLFFHGTTPDGFEYSAFPSRKSDVCQCG